MEYCNFATFNMIFQQNFSMCFKWQSALHTSYCGPVVSVFPQGTILRPSLLNLHIKDISVGIDFQIRLFDDDCVSYRVTTIKDIVDIRRDIEYWRAGPRNGLCKTGLSPPVTLCY